MIQYLVRHLKHVEMIPCATRPSGYRTNTTYLPVPEQIEWLEEQMQGRYEIGKSPLGFFAAVNFADDADAALFRLFHDQAIVNPEEEQTLRSILTRIKTAAAKRTSK